MDILSLPDNEPFIAGTDESIDICSNQIMKLSDASICHCRRGKARIEIDMQAYELTENTQILLLPGSIFNCTYASEDLSVSYIVFSDTPVQRDHLTSGAFFLPVFERASVHCHSRRACQAFYRTEFCHERPV